MTDEFAKIIRNELEEDKLVKLVMFGQFDLSFTFKVSKRALDYHNIDFNSLKELTDLNFLFKDKNLWNKIRMSSKNEKVKAALQLNRSSIQKVFVSFVSLKKIEFLEDIYRELVYTVAEQNFLFLNETDLEECDWETQLNFYLICGDQIKTFPLVKNKNEEEKDIKNEQKEESKEENKDDKNKENNKSPVKVENKSPSKAENKSPVKVENKSPAKVEDKSPAKEEDKPSSIEENKDNEEEKKDEEITNPLLKIKKEVYKDFDFIYFDIKDFDDTSPVFNYKNLSNFYSNLKVSGSEKEIEIVTNFLNFKNTIKKTEPLAYIYNILSLTSIYIFENNSANSLFNTFYTYKLHEQTKKTCPQFFYQSQSIKNNSLQKSRSCTELDDSNLPKVKCNQEYEVVLDKKMTVNFFANDILKNCPYNYFQKLAVFLDNFNKTYIVHLSPMQRIKKIYDFDSKITPKVNHYNCGVIKEYKDLINKNFIEYSRIYTNTFMGRLIYYFSTLTPKCLYLGYLMSVESTKKILEIDKNELCVPTKQEFFLVKISYDKIKKMVEEEKFKEKESNFKLDCVNASKSKMKYYNSLLDKNLNSMFSGVYLKELKNNGFVNTKGFIYYDPNYRETFGGKYKIQSEEVPPKVLYSCINKINVTHDISSKEINVAEQAAGLNSLTTRKLGGRRKDAGFLNTQKLFLGTKSVMSNKENCKRNMGLPRVKSSLTALDMKQTRSKMSLIPNKNYNLSKFKAIKAENFSEEI